MEDKIQKKGTHDATKEALEKAHLIAKIGQKTLLMSTQDQVKFALMATNVSSTNGRNTNKIWKEHWHTNAKLESPRREWKRLTTPTNRSSERDKLGGIQYRESFSHRKKHNTNPRAIIEESVERLTRYNGGRQERNNQPLQQQL